MCGTMEASFAVSIWLCIIVLVPISTSDSWESHQASSVTTMPSIGCILPKKLGSRNHMDLICSALDNSQTCGKIFLHGFIFNVTCNEGYIYDGFDGPTLYTLYVNGSWMPRIPECKRWCKPLKSPSVDVHCQYKGKDVDCSKSVPIGTEATGRCRFGFEKLSTAKTANVPIVCREDGQWSHSLIDCVTPACGRKSSTESVSSWSAMILQTGTHINFFNYYLHCLGTLISPHIVLASVRCLYSGSDKRVMFLQTYEVAVGIYLEELIRNRQNTKTVPVQKILLHPKYTGKDTNYAVDLAIMVLRNSVPFIPACVDWSREYVTTPGQIAMTPTWAFYGKPIYTQLHYVDYINCVSKVQSSDRRYLTPDKFCTTRTDGMQSIYGRGSGLMFERNGVYYVEGVLSGWLNASGGWIYVATNLRDMTLLDWLHEAKQSYDIDHH